jgi:heme/copper-type cytochrome/quinol oxidase subunit 2
MRAERLATLFAIIVVIGVPLAAVLARSNPDAIKMHGRIAEEGGWTPGDLTAQVGQPLHLRLTSDDVVHGFAVGQSVLPAVDVLPGQWTTTTLLFAQPGKYAFYCHAGAGLNHWRMRGTIEVTALL